MSDVNCAMAPVLTEPTAFTIPAPTPDDLVRRGRAEARARLVRLHDGWRRELVRLVRRHGRWRGRVCAAQGALDLAFWRLAVAEDANASVRVQPPPVGGLAHDAHSRALGTVPLLLVLGLCAGADYLIDRGALQALLLPLALTQTLALFIAVVQTTASHVAGRLLRRQRETADPGALREERTALRLILGFVALTVVGLAGLRGVFGGWLLVAIMLGVGAASTLVAVAASYLHTNTRLDALRRSERRVRWAGAAVTRRERRLGNALAGAAAARRALQAGAAGIVSRVERACDDLGVEFDPEPDWIVEARRVARGDDPSTMGGGT
jgi:hypothetical protein